MLRRVSGGTRWRIELWRPQGRIGRGGAIPWAMEVGYLGKKESVDSEVLVGVEGILVDPKGQVDEARGASIWKGPLDQSGREPVWPTGQAVSGRARARGQTSRVLTRYRSVGRAGSAEQGKALGRRVAGEKVTKVFAEQGRPQVCGTSF